MEDYRRKLQLKILELVKDVDKICQKHNIEYYIIYGSCLGAVRHKGFIPWDDDFDIMVKYDDYERFLRVCQEELDPEKYFVQTLETDKYYYLSFAKIRNIKTTFLVEGEDYDRMVNGIYIDVFPLVGYPKGKIKKAIFEINRAFTLSANRNIINNKFLANIFKVILKIFGKERIIKYCTKQCVKYKCDDCEQVVSVFDADGIKVNLTTNKIIGKPTYVDFEDTKLPIPENYDEYLKNIYGDYMKLPPKEVMEGTSHTPYILDLDHSYEEYKKIKDKSKK